MGQGSEPMSAQRFGELIQGLSIGLLRELHAIICRELDLREGRSKYQLPDHVQGML